VNRLFFAVIILAVLAAGLVGVLLSDIRWPSADIQSAYAAQELAKARKLEAEAAEAEAKARAASLDTQVLADAHAQRVQAEQMQALGWGAAVMVFSVGGALAVVVWGLLTAWKHGVTVFPNRDGLYPIFIQRLPGGGVRVLDTSRGLTPLMQIDASGEVSMPLPASEMTALQLATQAQQAAVMIGVSKRSGDDYDMPERISKAAQNVMTLAQPATGDGVRLVYVNDARRAQRDRRETELSELREFIQRGWLLGLSREKWLGTTFSCTGRRCSKSYWMTLVDRLSQAQVIEPKPGGGYQPIVTVDVALEVFGLSDQHAAVGQEPGDEHGAM
jgi:hypothetical protein